MFQRLQAVREEREGGFTLIELLVVVIIIAILAAIAIPVFLSQREKGWQAQADSAAKNAATAMETYGVENNGSYTGATLSKLETAGFNTTTDVTVTPTVSVDGLKYCITADHKNLDAAKTVYFHSDDGKPTTTKPTTVCP